MWSDHNNMLSAAQSFALQCINRVAWLWYCQTEKKWISELLGETPGAADCSCNPTNPLTEKNRKGPRIEPWGPPYPEEITFIIDFYYVFCTNTMTGSITHERPDETITGGKLQFETIFFTTKHGLNREQQQRFTLETNRSVPQQPKLVFALDIKRKTDFLFGSEMLVLLHGLEY